MNSEPASLPVRLPGGTVDYPRILKTIAVLVALVLFGVAIGEALHHVAVSLPLALGGCLALVCATALVIARYEVAITVGFLLSSIVLFQPAPSDALFGLVMIVALITRRWRFGGVPKIVLTLVSAFLILNVVSFTSVLSGSIAAKFFLITLYLLLFSVWLADYIDSASRARQLVRAYLFTAVLSAILATAALFVHFPLHQLLIGDQERARGLFKDPNVYGPFLVPIALIVAEEIFHPRLLRLRKRWRVACFIILALGVVFSYSRAAWLNLALGVIVLIVLVTLRQPDRRAISLILTVMIGIVAIAGAIVVTGSLHFLDERAKLQSYDTHRFAAQSRGLSLGLTHPFGVGPGQFELISPVASHSLYIRSLSEQGPLGLLVIISLIVTTLALGATNVVKGRDTYGISAAALLAAWTGVVANSFFVDTLHWRHLWLVAGLIWAGAMRETTLSAGRRRQSRALPIGEAVASLQRTGVVQARTETGRSPM